MRAYRSPLRLFAFGIVGILLLVAAIDVLFGHWLATAPETSNDTLTTRGQAQQRGDILWGAAMIGAGTLLVGGAVVELVRRKALVVVTSDGLVMAIGHHESNVVAPWGSVDDVTSDTVVDPYDGAVREVLVVALTERSGFPSDPIGAMWEGNTLLIDAHDWTRSVTDVALSAQGALGHYRRVEEIKEMGPPSVEWEGAADGPTDLASAGALAAGSVAVDVRDTDHGDAAEAAVPNHDPASIIDEEDSAGRAATQESPDVDEAARPDDGGPEAGSDVSDATEDNAEEGEGS